MRLAETFGRHASERALLAVIAGETPGPHVPACASCQARLEALRAWVDATAADAGALADEVFTPDRLAAQKSRILARLEAAGRSARVIAFPIGGPAPVRRATREVLRWTAAAAVGGLMVGLVSGRFFDGQPPAPMTAGTPAPSQPTSATAGGGAAALDEAALLDAAYDRISLESLRTIDDMTPRAREVVIAGIPRSRR